jgi:hypothetical protein
MRVYIGSGLHEDKNPMSYVRWCIIIHLVEAPLYPSFSMIRGLGFQRKIQVSYCCK